MLDISQHIIKLNLAQKIIILNRVRSCQIFVELLAYQLFWRQILSSKNYLNKFFLDPSSHLSWIELKRASCKHLKVNLQEWIFWQKSLKIRKINITIEIVLHDALFMPYDEHSNEHMLFEQVHWLWLLK